MCCADGLMSSSLRSESDLVSVLSLLLDVQCCTPCPVSLTCPLSGVLSSPTSTNHSLHLMRCEAFFSSVSSLLCLSSCPLSHVLTHVFSSSTRGPTRSLRVGPLSCTEQRNLACDSESCVEAFHVSRLRQRAVRSAAVATGWPWIRHIAIPLVVHSCARASAMLRSCIVDRLVRLVRTLACLAALASTSGCDPPKLGVVTLPRDLVPVLSLFLRSCCRCVLSWHGASWSVGTSRPVSALRSCAAAQIDQPTELMDPFHSFPCLCCPASSSQLRVVRPFVRS